MEKRKLCGYIFGSVSICTMLFGWGVFFFLPEHDDANGVNQWNYLGSHPSMILIIALSIGALSGCIAGLKTSKLWYLVAALNAIGLMLEAARRTM